MSLTPIRSAMGHIFLGTIQAIAGSNSPLQPMKILARLTCTALMIGRDNPELADLLLKEMIDNSDAQADVDDLRRLIEEAVIEGR